MTSTVLSEESELVGESDIVKYYCPDEQRRYFAYQQFKELSKNPVDYDSEVAGLELGVSKATLDRWSWSRDSDDKRPRGAEPRSVQGVELLKAHGLLPLTTISPTLGLVSYLAGLNWFAGNIHASRSGQPASCPQFFVDGSSLFPNIVKTLDFDVNYNPKRERYTLPSQVTLLFSELGLPSNGSKASCPEPYPYFVDALLAHDKRDPAILFLGAQALTKAARRRGSVIISTIHKDSEELAWSAGKGTYDLYRIMFPTMEIGTPKLHVSKGKHYATIRMSEDKHKSLVERTHRILRQEWCRVKQPGF